MLFKPVLPHGFAGRCFPGLGCQSSITPLTCTLFDPCIFAPDLGNPQFSDFPQGLPICPKRREEADGKYSAILPLKSPYRADTGLTSGLLCLLPVFCIPFPVYCLICRVSSVLFPFLILLHKAPNRADIPAGGYIFHPVPKTGHKGLQGATKAGESFPPPVIFPVHCQIPIFCPYFPSERFLF